MALGAGEARDVQIAGYLIGCWRLKGWNVRFCLVDLVKMFDNESLTYKCRNQVLLLA